MTLIAAAPFAMTGLDPFKAEVPVLIGFGSFGVIFLQAFAAVAIVVYLRRAGGEPLWVMAASWAGAIGLVGASIFVAVNFKLLAISESLLVGLLPFVFPIIVLGVLWIGALVRFKEQKSAAAGRNTESLEGLSVGVPITGNTTGEVFARGETGE
jgi:hypothetical protein